MESKGSLNIALVGFGYWGPKLLRNLKNSNNYQLRYLIDLDEAALNDFKFSNPEVEISTKIDVAILDKSIDCIAIATPPHTHFNIAKKCIENGKHILIEKPFTTSFNDALALKELAEKMGVKIMVDYTFLYNGTVQCIKEEITKKEFGDLLYIDSVRINLGIFQSNVNVVWDLACHDISIFNYLLNELPTSVQAIGIDGLNNGIENIAYIHLRYPSKFAHINCSWSSPVKIRKMLIGGTKRAILYNDIEPTDKIKIYDKGVVFPKESDRDSILQDYRIGEVFIPKYDTAEPLQKVINTFYEDIVYGKEGVSNSESALLVMFILEMVQKSINLNGKEIIIDWKQVGVSLYSYIMSKGILKEQ